MENKAKLFAALAQFQSKMDGAKKDAVNPHFKSKYADLSSVVDAIKTHSVGLNLSYTHIIKDVDNKCVLTTYIVWSDGTEMQHIESSLEIPHSTGTNAMQSKGSAVTYAKRYTLQGLFGIPSEDDDGNAVGNVNAKAPTPTPTPMSMQQNSVDMSKIKNFVEKMSSDIEKCADVESLEKLQNEKGAAITRLKDVSPDDHKKINDLIADKINQLIDGLNSEIMGE